MRNGFKAAAFAAVVAACGWITAGAQSPTVQMHDTKARAAVYAPGQDFTQLYDLMCAPDGDYQRVLAGRALGEPAPQRAAGPPPQQQQGPRVPPRNAWYTEPEKVFDNLYYVGTQTDSSWAVKTSDGIILVDSSNAYAAQDLEKSLRKFNLDPAQIKYIVLSHGHADRYGASRYLQDTYHPHVIVSAADWELMAKDNTPEANKPQKDMVATDGMKLTLGDTTLTLYLTPGHTTGTVSTLVPLKDGNQRHVGVIWGGLGPAGGGPRADQAALAQTLSTYLASLKRGREVASAAGADTFLLIHPRWDKGLDKLRALEFRSPGDPNPFVNKKAVDRFFTVMSECLQAQLARISG